jgi:hypothetical protein
VSLAIAARDLRDRIAVVGPDGKVILWADYTQAQALLKFTRPLWRSTGTRPKINLLEGGNKTPILRYNPFEHRALHVWALTAS